MSKSRPNQPERLESVLYGVKTFDLSTDRAIEDDYELIRLPNARSITPVTVPDECYLHFGDARSPAVDLREYVGQQFTVQDENRTFGAVYLENPTGATGTLEIFHGAEVGVQSNPEVSKVQRIDQAVDVSNRSGREIGKARLEESGGTLIDPAQNADGAAATASAAGTGSVNAAAIAVPDGRRTVTVAYDVSGAAVITVEVSPDGGTTWYPLTSYSPGSAESAANTVETGFADVRAYVDANLNSLHIGAKGV